MEQSPSLDFNTQMKVDSIVEGVRSQFNYRYESCEVLPGWDDGFLLYGRADEESGVSLMIGVKESHFYGDSVKKIGDFVVKEVPIHGHFADPYQLKIILAFMAELCSSTRSFDRDMAPPSIRRLFASFDLKSESKQDSKFDQAILHRAAEDLKADVIVPDWCMHEPNLVETEFHDAQGRLPVNVEAEFLFSASTSLGELSPVLERHLEIDASKITEKIYFGSGIRLRPTRSPIIRASLRARQV